MATSNYVGIDVSKDRLDVAVLGEVQGWQMENIPEGIARLVQQMQDLQPELIVVEATADLANPVWTPVGTNTLTGGSSYFSDPQWTNYLARFYRLRSP